MSLEASQGVIRRVECRECGRTLGSHNRSGLCEFHKGRKLRVGLCRTCPAATTKGNRSGYCVACREKTVGQREAKRKAAQERYARNRVVVVSPCRHCQIRQVSRARGLCFRCSRDAAIRNLYPTTSKYANKGISADGEDDFEPQPCPEPTEAIPGTEAKLAVLEARAAARVELWHGGDVRFVFDSRGIAIFKGDDDDDY